MTPVARTAEPPTLREARAGVFAGVCVLVGAVGHDAFSPSSIPMWALVVGGLAVFLAAQLFTQRERGLPTILVLMGVMQFGLHHLFVFAQKLAADATPMAMAAGAPARGAWWCGHDEPSGVTQSMLHVAGMPPTQHTMTAGMYLAHAAAALTAAWWLRRGEAAVWSVGRALALALVAPLVLLAALVSEVWTPARWVAAVGYGVPDRLGPGRLLRFALARRGPPVAVAAAV
ncbi:MAG: hypothetical protein HOV87_17230 [Catenulispora sp.]|nr:hypothetical protein [Catenulispora sp.]